MSNWTDRVKTHAVWGRIEETTNVIRTALGEITDDESRVDLERLHQCMTYIKNVLAAADPLLLSPNALNTIDQNLISVQNEVNAFRSNKNRQHLAYANNNVDNTIASLAQIPKPVSNEHQIESITEVRDLAELSLSTLNKKEGELRSSLEKIKAQVDTLEPAINDQKKRLDNALAAQQDQFSKAQEKRNQDFSQQQQNLSNESQTFADSLKDSANVTLSELTIMRDKAQNLLHIIGNTGMAGEYGKTANAAKWASLGWQTVAFFALIGLLFFAYEAYQAIKTPEFNISATLGRAFVAAAVGILAAYAARQADIYQRGEDRARRYQLILSSIDPYVSSLKEEQRESVKMELAKTLFGNTSIESPNATTASFDGNVSEVLKLMVQLAQAMSRK